MIWNKIKDGDLDAFGSLYDDYIDKLYRYGINICSDKELVKDCIHDLFVDLFKYRKNLCDTNNIEYYLLKSLKNKLLKRYQSKISFLEIDSYRGILTEELETLSEEDTIIEIESRQEKYFKLEIAMNSLTKQQKKVINLRYLEEMSYSEIAGSLNISVETARTIIYRGMKLLRKNMISLLVLLFY